ncbi:fatty-acid amide hydrolase 1-like [Cherax quadricarinatus]
MKKSEEKLQDSVDRRQAEVRGALDRLEAKLNDAGELLTEERISILSLPPSTLLHRLRNGQLAPTHVLRAFQAKAIVVTYRLNCVTEFIPQAEEWATELEAAPPETRTLPLFGLPVSLKDTIDVEGRDSTMGLAKRLYRPALCHAAVVQALRAQGAVPFCKTNVSQLCVSYGCSNPVWGVTLNPANTQRTCGGSSGGEGALVGAGGSLLGVGTDLAGSVRIPAHFCGVVGIKTTSGRMSTRGIARPINAAGAGVLPSMGLLGRDVEIVVAGMRALLEADYMFLADPAMAPLSWRQHLYTDVRPLRIGWYDFDGVLPATPGCRRAVAEAREALQAAGHELVAFTPPEVRRAWGIMTTCITADKGRTVSRLLTGEVADPSLATSKLMAQPKLVKAVKKRILQGRSPFMARLLSSEGVKSHQLWQALEEKQVYVEQLTEAWRKARLDLLLAPAFSMPAPPLNCPTNTTAALITTCLYNFCDFPSGVVPVTHEDEDDQAKLNDYPTDDLLFHMVKEATEGATGLPIGVQVVGLPWQEEVVCRGMRDLQDHLKVIQGEKDHP